MSNRVWRSYQGGRLLDELASKPVPSDSHWPEDWIGSTTRAINPGRDEPEAGISQVVVGDATVALPELIARDPEYFLGAGYLSRFGERVVPLVKFLDSAVRLHFQCHPTIPFALRHFNSPWGKAEAYHILRVRPEQEEGYIYLGFQRPPSRDEMRRMVLEQDMEALEACFDRIPVEPGETYFVPGGVPHAIGPGVLMVEVMEPTDFVSRFEWSKCGFTLPESARFMGRDVEFGLDMLDFEAVPVQEVRNRYQPRPERLDAVRERLLGAPLTKSFSIERLRVSGSANLNRDRYSINIVLEGQLKVRSEGGELEVGALDRFLLPAGVGEVEYSGLGTILSCLPPEAGA